MIGLRGIFDNYNSYGILGTEIADGLIRAGLPIRCIAAIDPDYRDSDWNRTENPKLHDYWADPSEKLEKELVILPPDTACLQNSQIARRRVHFTMFESPRLCPSWITFENSCEAVIVPCEGNLIAFNSCGVNAQLFKVPLGYNPENTYYSPMNMQGPCVFGIGGRIHKVTDFRKGAERAVELFKRAFPGEENVLLDVKTLSCDEPCVNEHDSRVKLTRSFIAPEQMHEWYSGLTCYLSLTCSEGWGLMQFEAMVSGRPIISTNYMGVREFFIPENGYEIKGRYVRANVWPNSFEPGVWCEPEAEDVVKAMRRVYADRAEAERKGLASSKHVRGYTWSNTVEQIIDVLKRLEWV